MKLLPMKSKKYSRIYAINQVFPVKLACFGIAFLFVLSLMVKNLDTSRKLIASPVSSWEERLKGPLGPEDPSVIDFIRKHKVINPGQVGRYNLLNPGLDPSLGQSIIVKKLLANKTKGFFVECGAYDGEERSNTLSLEKDLGWTGLLIEANRLNYIELAKKNRQAWITNACLAVHNYPHQAVFFLNGSTSRQIPEPHIIHWNTRAQRNKLMTVQCFPLVSFLLSLNVHIVDYLSLDVEGTEFDILATIPFNKLRINVLSVEITHGKWLKNTTVVLRKFMANRGYKFVTRLIANNSFANDLIFVHRELRLKAKLPPEVYFYKSNVVDQYARRI